MRRMTDPWPALSDLFSGLLVACFGGLMLSMGKPPDPVSEKAHEIRNSVKQRLTEQLGGRTSIEGDDVLIHVDLHFDRNKATILSEDRQKIEDACKSLKQLFQENKSWHRAVEIWIEGHTDSTQPVSAATARDRYLYNWDLSGRRADSVLYEFQTHGLDPRLYKIMAIGYADSRPLTGANAEEGDRLSRRTTFRIRLDKCVIEKDILGRIRAPCAWP